MKIHFIYAYSGHSISSDPIDWGGRKIKVFYEAWKNACKKAGIEGKLFHDLRWTGVINIVRADIQEQATMRISGHKISRNMPEW